VNAAAMGEAVWGAGQGLTDFLYFTIGTGVGGGAIINGRPLHGMIHPEMGHIPLAHDWQADPYKGRCPYHRDCFEGLTAGPAMKERWGVSAETLPLDHAAWQLEAHYIAMAMNVFAYSFSPQRIILGGGVMQQLQLFPMIRKEMLELLNGYIQAPAILEHIDTYLVPPMLGGKAGMLGCIALAKQAFEK
jgi:fructokinase